MKITTKLLLLAAFIVLALPLVFTGNASAVVFNPDGLSLNPATGMWELPVFGSTGIAGCYDGTTTINDTATTGPDASRFKCYNLQGTPANALTTNSACVATGTTPAGWTASVSIGRWAACSLGGYSANTTNPLTDCATNGGTVDAFSRCNRSLAPGNCNTTNLPGFSWVSTGTSASSYVCSTTGMNATDCAAYAATFGSTTVVGSYSVAASGFQPANSCAVYISDTASCTTAGGAISAANVDETRGYCGGNWMFKTGTVGDWGSSVRNNCTKCHNPQYMASSGTDFETFEGHLINSVRDAGLVFNYGAASHKNASRKIVAGQQLANVWISTDGSEQFGIFPYLPGLNSPQTDSTVSPNFNIRMVDWVNGKIEDTTTNSSHVGLRNLPTGVYTEWYWEFGYYGEDPERGVYNGAAGANGKPSAKMAACFACHGTGYVGLAAKDTTKEPEKSFPNISWDFVTTYTPSSRPGVVNLQNNFTNRVTNVKGTYTYGGWDQYGVVCAKCHNAAGGSHTSGGDGQANPTTGVMVNATCGQCHIRAGSSDWAVTAGTNVLTTRNQVGTGHPNYHETDFLNSPHARFTGTYGQVATASKYSSAFMTSYAGCVGCHNPHGTVRFPLLELAGEDEEIGHGEDESLGPMDGVEEGCLDCHSTVKGSTQPIDFINHPNGEGTPMGSVEIPSDGCAICHMPGGRHLFRITTDTNYTTTQPTAFPLKPDGTFTEAVWIGLKESCGQCHGHTAVTLTKDEYQARAINIHGTRTATFTWAPDATIDKKVNFDASTSTCQTAPCTYAWTFGDGSVGTGVTTSRTYASAGNYVASVTVTDSAAKVVTSPAQTVQAISTNTAPTASKDTPPVLTATTATIHDTSTDAQDASGTMTATLICGNNTLTTGPDNSDLVCTYTTAGTYTIKHSVKDSGGLGSSSANVQVVIAGPAKTTVSGKLTRQDGTTPIPYAILNLQVGGVTKYTTTSQATTGNFNFTNVVSGTYTVKAVKAPNTFTLPAEPTDVTPIVVSGTPITGQVIRSEN